eukprot:4888704-Amphidinium_carterae.1
MRRGCVAKEASLSGRTKILREVSLLSSRGGTALRLEDLSQIINMDMNVALPSEAVGISGPWRERGPIEFAFTLNCRSSWLDVAHSAKHCSDQLLIVQAQCFKSSATQLAAPQLS